MTRIGPVAPQVLPLAGPEDAKSKELLKAAREFEGLLLRHVLESLGKTASVGSSRGSSSTAYQSMVVDAMADGLSTAGGIGLSDLVAKMLEGELGGRNGH